MCATIRILACYLAFWLALGGPGAPIPAIAQQRQAPTGAGKELIAVMDLGLLDASEAQRAALTKQLRVEVLKTGQVTLVDRSQLDAVLEEQALQQTGCTSEECAVQVGKILGIRKIVTGSITKISDTLWQVSVQLIEVETAETVKAEAFNHRGPFEDLLIDGMKNVAKLLFPPGKEELKAQVETAPAAPPPAPAAPPPPEREAPEVAGPSTWPLWSGLALLAGAGLLFSQALNEASAAEAQADKSRDNNDPGQYEEAQAKLDDAETTAQYALILSVVGAGLLAYYWLAGSGDADAVARASGAPALHPSRSSPTLDWTRGRIAAGWRWRW